MPHGFNRKYNRVPYGGFCCIFRRGEELDIQANRLRIIDISAGGVAIESDRSYSLVEELTLRFGEKETGQVEEQGIVTYCNLQDNGKYHVGINFCKEQ